MWNSMSSSFDHIQWMTEWDDWYQESKCLQINCACRDSPILNCNCCTPMWGIKFFTFDCRLIDGCWQELKVVGGRWYWLNRWFHACSPCNKQLEWSMWLLLVKHTSLMWNPCDHSRSELCMNESNKIVFQYSNSIQFLITGRRKARASINSIAFAIERIVYIVIAGPSMWERNLDERCIEGARQRGNQDFKLINFMIERCLYLWYIPWSLVSHSNKFK